MPQDHHGPTSRSAHFSLDKQLRVLESRMLSAVGDISARRHWLIRATAITIGVSLFLTFPRVSFFWGDSHITDVWHVVEWQAAHLFRPIVSAPADHEAKRNLRLLQPMLLYLTQQGCAFGLAVQFVLGVLSIALATAMAYRLGKDRVAAVLTGFGFGQILAGKIAFLDLGGKGDGFSIFLLLAALAARNVLLLAVICFAACYCDERAAIAMGLVLLFHATDSDGRLKADGRVIAVLAAVTLYLATRMWLEQRFGLSTPVGNTSGVGGGVFLHNMSAFHVLIPQSLLGFWVPYLLSMVFLVFYRRWLTLGAYVAVPLCVIGVALCVFDADRSLVYLAPLIFIPFRWAWLQASEARRIYLVVALVCLLLPTNALYGVYEAPGMAGRYREGNLMFVELVRAFWQAREQLSRASQETAR